MNDQSAQELRAAIADLQMKQTELGVDFGPQLAQLQERLQVLQSGSGAVAMEGGVAGGEGAVVTGGDVKGNVVVVKEGGTAVFQGDQPVTMTAVDQASTLGRYLSHVISRNRYLQLQGIRSGGRLVNIELEHIYITLKSTATRTLDAEQLWLAKERARMPGERHGLAHESHTETITVKVQQALSEHRHLVVLGDPGSGKTTLMRYLTLCFARDRAEGGDIVRQRLGLNESGSLPILMPLRNFGAFLRSEYAIDNGTDGQGKRGQTRISHPPHLQRQRWPLRQRTDRHDHRAECTGLPCFSSR